MQELKYMILCVLLVHMRNNIHNMLIKVAAIEFYNRSINFTRCNHLFVDCWLKVFDHSYLSLSNMYIENIQYLFKKKPVQIPKPLSLKEKCQSILHSIGDDWYMKKMNENITPLNK